MEQATKTTTTALGIMTGILGFEHGLYEFLQGNVVPHGLMISAIGPPCQSEKAWHGCEPALTVISNMGITGILAIIASLLVIIWSVMFLHRKNGALIFGLLSLLLFPIGGGFLPPLFGIITSISAGQIKPEKKDGTAAPLNGIDRILAKTWPWSLIGFFMWSLIEWILGTYFNDGLLALALLPLLLMMTLLFLSIFSSFAYDRNYVPK